MSESDITKPWKNPKSGLNHRAYWYVAQLDDLTTLEKLLCYTMAVEMGATGTCHRSIEDLAAFCCVTRHTLGKTIDELMARGILGLDTYPGDDMGAGRMFPEAWIQPGERPMNQGGRPRRV